jgi:pimeloyl-ACP methyl ester carboxylesterase
MCLAVAVLLVGGSIESLPATPAVYQFGLVIPKDPVPPDAPKLAKPDPNTLGGDTHAFLWIPPHATKLRGVLLCPANIIERRICSDPVTRDEAARDNLAMIFFQAGWGKNFVNTPRLVPFIEGMLNQFADKSGYEELRTVPWIPFGHSGNSQFCQALARQKPERTIANVVIKGALPNPDKDGSTSGLVGVPILFVTGQFEEVAPPKGVRDAWWDVQMQRFATAKTAVPQALINGIEDRSHGHLNWFPDMAAYVALFIHNAVTARVGSADAPTTTLAEVPFDSGWLADPDEKAPSAPVKAYPGDPAKAFWFFNEAQVKAWQVLYDKDRGKKEQLLAFVQDGAVLPFWNGWVVQQMKFEPLPGGDTFTAEAQFRDEVPKPFADAGTKLGHSATGEINYQVLGWAGNIEQVGPKTFRVAFDREGVNGRTLHVLIGAIHPGDEEYRETVAVATMDLPGSNPGTPQKITFPPIADVPAGTTSLPLKATVDSGRKPDYYVSWGPAEIDGDTLKITDVPDRAKYPIEVSVTAYQWGSASDPKFATAQPVTQVFHIVKP